MNHEDVRLRAFVQARMSSRRLPGKVLAPFRGRPIIRHVVDAVERAFGPQVPVTVVTSIDRTDDPLAAYLSFEGVDVFRGALDNVFARFRACHQAFPSEWILRLNGDSPLLNPVLLQRVADQRSSGMWDLVTTTFPRTFPVGQNAELLRAALLDQIHDDEMSVDEREHVTQYFYRRPDRFRIVNLESNDAARANLSLAIDTLEDLLRLEALSDDELQMLGAA